MDTFDKKILFLNNIKKKLLESGCHFGHSSSLHSPLMKRFFFLNRENFDVIDLDKTIVCLKKVYTFFEEEKITPSDIIFVGTKRNSSEIIKEVAEKIGSFYVNTK